VLPGVLLTRWIKPDSRAGASHGLRNPVAHLPDLAATFPVQHEQMIMG
jgi:hypothetical protein